MHRSCEGRFCKMRHLACCLLLAGCGLLVIVACTARDAAHVLTIGDYQVNGNARDSYSAGTSNNPSAAFVRLGQGASADNTAGFQFASITLPKDATITTATLSANISATAGSGWSLKVYGEASDSCVNFQTTWPSSRTLTAANVTWNIGSGTGWKTSPSIAAVIQEVVTRSGWASGHNLCLIVQDNQSTANTYQDAYSYDASPANAAKLSVNYSDPTPTPTVTPTPDPHCGQIITDTTWTGSYTATCNIAVARGVTLTLAPGTTVNMAGPYKWDVDGTLHAIGLPTSTITLTSAATTAGSWGPLFVRGNASMDFITVTYGSGLELAAPAAITRALLLSNTRAVDFLWPGSLMSSTVRNCDTGIIVRGNVAPLLQAVNIVSSTTGLWNAQSLTLTVPGLWWGSTVSATIESAIRDQADDWRLGRVEWWPSASAAW